MQSKFFKISIVFLLLLTLPSLTTNAIFGFGGPDTEDGNYYLYYEDGTVAAFRGVDELLALSTPDTINIESGTIVKITDKTAPFSDRPMNILNEHGQLLGDSAQVKILEGDKAGNKYWVHAARVYRRTHGPLAEETAFKNDREPIVKWETVERKLRFNGEQILKEVTFNAESSYDIDSSINSYNWNFGNGSKGSGKVVTHRYKSEGEYEVKLAVSDKQGETNSLSKTISIPITEVNENIKILNWEVNFDGYWGKVTGKVKNVGEKEMRPSIRTVFYDEEGQVINENQTGFTTSGTAYVGNLKPGETKEFTKNFGGIASENVEQIYVFSL